MRHLTTATAALIAGVLVATLGAQQNPRTLGPVSGPVLTIDFGALDAKGQPVTNLNTADIAVRIDGKLREVRQLQLITRDKPLPLGTPASDPMPVPFVSNAAASDTGRTVFVIFDNETMATGREQRVRDGVVALINLLGPRDQMAILTVPHGGIATDLTSNHDMLRAAAAKLTGAAPTTETTDEAACRSRLTVQAIQSILSQRAGAETPTDVILISSSLSGPRSNISSGVTSLGRGSIGGCQLPNDDFIQLGNAATAARARFYIVQPEQIRAATAVAGADSPLAGLENIASLTGAPIMHLAGADEPHFQRVAMETSSYYAATIVLDPTDRGSTRQALSVKTTRADVTIQSRPQVALTSAGPATRGAAPAPKDMLRTATTYRDTSLRLTAFTSRNAGDGKVKIVAMAESMAGAKFSAAAIGVYDSTNKLIAQWSADAPALAAPMLLTAFVQNPGQYRVRVAATDTAGRAGTADFDVNATLTPAAGVLSLSTLVLGTPDNNFTPKFQFTTEPQAVAYFELYGGKQGMPVSVNVELATTLNGPAMAQLQPKISASPESDKYIVMTPIAIGSLPPGDYIIRAIVGLDGQPAGRIVRTLRKAQ